jgi:hypothetical protein
MNTYPCRLILDSETKRKLQMHSITINSPSISIEDFNSRIDAAVIGLQNSNDEEHHAEAHKLTDMQIWTTGQIRRMGILPSGSPNTFSY